MVYLESGKAIPRILFRHTLNCLVLMCYEMDSIEFFNSYFLYSSVHMCTYLSDFQGWVIPLVFVPSSSPSSSHFSLLTSPTGGVILSLPTLCIRWYLWLETIVLFNNLNIFILVCCILNYIYLGNIGWNLLAPTFLDWPPISHNAPNPVFCHPKSPTGKLSFAYTPQRMPHSRFCSQWTSLATGAGSSR